MFTQILLTFLIAMVPVIELRGAIPIGVGMGLDPVFATLIAVLGNLAPIPLILLLLEKIFDFLRTKNISRKFVETMEKRVAKKRSTIDKYGIPGLIIFVAIPLPGTGAWTGALIAGVLKLKLKPAFLSIAVGVLIAATIVFALTYGATILF